MSRFRNPSLLAQGERVTDTQLQEEKKILNFTRAAEGLNRRRFIKSAGLAAGAASLLAASGCSNSGTIETTFEGTPSPLNVLQFALNLEYFEATFYSYIATGSGLPSNLLPAGSGAVTGGAKVTFTNSFVNTIAQNLMMDELDHVQFLQQTITSLGGTPVPAPALNLAAMGAPSNDATFVALARALETVGTSAYAGGAQYLVSNPAGLTYAAQILHVEAQHEGALRQLCIQLGAASPAVDSMDYPPPPTGTQVFNTNPTTGLNAVRTVSQVLQIVYAAPGRTGVYSGGFFPQGLTGTLIES